MPLFGRRKRQPADSSPFEAPPIEHAGAEQLAKPPSPSPAAGYGRLTAEDVRNVTFGRPRLGKRGYDDTHVDAFLELVELELSRSSTPNEEGGLSPQDVEDTVFFAPPWGKRGYNEEQVQAFVQRIAAELRYRAAKE